MVCRTIKELETRWERLCNKIEKTKLTREQARIIARSCIDEIMVFGINKSEKMEGVYDLIQVMSEIVHTLNISPAIAVSNYEEKHGTSLFAKIFGNKEFNIDFNAVKNELNNKII